MLTMTCGLLASLAITPAIEAPQAAGHREIARTGEGFHIDQVLTCALGEPPGQYTYRNAPGMWIWPITFTIDSTSGNFLIPDTDAQDRTRLLRFDRKGRHISTVLLEDLSDDVYAVTTAPGGTIFMTLSLPRQAETYIAAYDEQGRRLIRFGPKGPFTPEEIAAEEESIRVGWDYQNLDKYFLGSTPYELHVLENGDLIAMPRYDPLLWKDPTVNYPAYRFDPITGRCLDQANEVVNLKRPPGLDERIQAKWRAWNWFARSYERSTGQRYLNAMPHPVLDDQGHLYFMTVDHRSLDIYKVTFDDPTTTAPASQPEDATTAPAVSSPLPSDAVQGN